MILQLLKSDKRKYCNKIKGFGIGKKKHCQFSFDSENVLIEMLI